MKFGKRLRTQMEDMLPGWQNHFLSYKQLKKRLKTVNGYRYSPPSSPRERSIKTTDLFAVARNGGGGLFAQKELPELVQGPYTMKETEWVALLDEELKKLNAFAMAKEEDFVIKHSILRRKLDELVSDCDNLTECQGCAELLNDLRTEIVRFHSELVFLIHFRDLNYTGLAKILKKHDKRTGMLLRDPYLQMALCQPFCVTDQVTKMIRWCDDQLQLLMGPGYGQDWHHGTVSLIDMSALIEDSSMRDVYRSQIAALRILEELVNSASTPSVIPMPPITVSRARTRGSSRLRPGGTANEQAGNVDGVEGAAADRDEETNDRGVSADQTTTGLSNDREPGSRAAIAQRNPAVLTSGADGNRAGETQHAENHEQSAELSDEAAAPPRTEDAHTRCEREEESGIEEDRKLPDEERQQQDADTVIIHVSNTCARDVADKKTQLGRGKCQDK